MALSPEERAQFDAAEAARLTEELHAVRGRAIQSYARLEQSLCSTFAHLAGVTNQIAGIVFFKMVNARSRIAVLERLKRLKHGDAFNLYFNSIMAEAGRLDGLRNQLIHWHSVHAINASPEGNEHDMYLAPPNFWDFNENSPTMSLAQIREFDERCDIFSRGLSILTSHWMHPELVASRDIFEQPLQYPLPEGHPLDPHPQAQPTQPEA